MDAKPNQGIFNPPYNLLTTLSPYAINVNNRKELKVTPVEILRY